MTPRRTHRTPEGPAPLERAWSRDVADVLRELDVDPARGLSDAEVARRLALHGPNRMRETARRSGWRILWDQFASWIVLLLAVAAAVGFAFGELVEGGAILVVIVVNALIGFVTESRAVRSVEALRELGQRSTTVRRGGAARVVPAEELVPGDVVVVDAGDVSTADLRVITGSRLRADESALTGESVPVDKDAAPAPADAALAERTSMLFKGTALTDGSGEAVVVGTGMHTELGEISKLVVESDADVTPLEKRLDALGKRLIGLTLVVAVLVAVSVMVTGRGALLAVEIAIALAVATIPEGLPIVATVALARGMGRMAKRDALVDELSAVETLGSTTVLLTDKTGTLTENRMTAVAYAIDGRDVEVEGTGLEPRGRFTSEGREVDPRDVPALAEALRVGALCNHASFDVGADGAPATTGDPTEVALLVAAAKAGLRRGDLLAATPQVDEVAFDPATKRMATAHRDGDACFTAVKGAPEAVLDRCATVRTQGGSAPLDDAARAEWLRRADRMAARGLRVLGLATRRGGRDDDRFADLELLALVGLLDPPRPGAQRAIEDCRAAGIRVVMVTGDHAATGLAIGGAVGLARRGEDALIDARRLPPFAELDEAQRDALLDADVIARADPRQKLDLIDMHQARGAVVAMTGDGVNDAPALKKADIGVAMGMRGTQVAREAADMVLRDDELGTIVAAVSEGRAIFENIRRFVVYLLSCNVSEILVVGVGSLIPGPLPILPLQILFLNMVTDVFPALALGVCEGSPSLMRSPPRDPREPVLTRAHWRSVFGLAAVMAAGVMGAMAVAQHALGLAGSAVTTVSFLTLALAQLWHAFSMRSARSHWLRNEVTRNRWLWAALALCVALLVAGVYVPLAASVLEVTDPGAAGWATAMAFSLLPVIVGNLALERGARRARAAGAE